MRVDYQKAAPDAVKAMYGLSNYVKNCSIEENLRLLVELRVSLINGCAFCIDLHSNELRAAGELQQRIELVSVWEEVPFYTNREKAALKWAETLTRVSQNHVPDEVFEEVSPHFTETELVDLTMVIVGMNAWNRIAISFRQVPPTRRALHKV
jgi:AhpD family alkylhydroperoxidase